MGFCYFVVLGLREFSWLFIPPVPFLFSFFPTFLDLISSWILSFQRQHLKTSNKQAAESERVPRVEVDFSLIAATKQLAAAHSASAASVASLRPTRTIEAHIHVPEEEIALGPACWFVFVQI